MEKNPGFTIQYRNIIVAIIIIVLAAILRLSDLDHESLFMDEIYQVSAYKLPLNEILDGSIRQQQPPLDYLIGHVSFLFNTSDFSARLPAALFGIGSIFLTLLLLWNNTTPAIALFCSLLYSLSPFHIYYSQEARPYSIAIFLFLLLMKTIEWVEKNNEIKLINYFILWFVQYLFLLSRLLSPLCVVAIINFYFFIRVIYALSVNNKDLIRKSGLYIIVSFMSILCYLPVLFKIFTSASRYLDKEDTTSTLYSAFINFNIFPGLISFITQLDPLGFTLPVIAIISFYLTIQLFSFKNQINIFCLFGFILIGALPLHLFIFLSNTSFPYRPPYAIYLQPCAIIVLAFAIQKVINLKFNKYIVISISTLIIVLQISTVYSFKNTTHRTEWKQSIENLNQKLSKDHLVIFGTLAGRKAWKPDGWGTLRYPLNIPHVNLPSLLKSPETLDKNTLKPVLCLFYYREYKLRPSSKYPIQKNEIGVINYNWREIAGNEKIRITHFNGIIIFQLAEYSGNCLKDTQQLLRNTIDVLPLNDGLIDTLMLSHQMETICPSDNAYHYTPIELAESVAKKEDLEFIEKIKRMTRDLVPLCIN